MIDQRQVLRQLAELQYQRNDIDFSRGTYRVRGDVIDIFPAEAERRRCASSCSTRRSRTSASSTRSPAPSSAKVPRVTIFPKTHYVTPRDIMLNAIEQIEVELEERSPSSRRQQQAGRGAAPAAAHALRHRDDSANWATARGSRTTRAISPGAPRASRRRRCSSTCQTMRWWSSTSPTPVFRRSAPCTAATARARRPWWNTASGCRRRWTTAPCVRGVGAAAAAGDLRLRHAGSLRGGTLRGRWWSRWCAPRAWSTRSSRCARRARRSTTCSEIRLRSTPASACW
jgi:hypothetical protein